MVIVFTYNFKPVFGGNYELNNFVYNNAEYSVYCLDLTENLSDCVIIKNGNSNIIKTNLKNAKYVKSHASYVLGESIRFFSCKLNIEKLIDYFKISVKKIEKTNDIFCLYGYCPDKNFTNSVEIENCLINIQIAFKDDYITIGTPIILGDY